MKVIIIKEKSAGNESVGEMWLETKSFDESATLKDVLDWQPDKHGKLIITVDQSSEDGETKF